MGTNFNADSEERKRLYERSVRRDKRSDLLDNILTAIYVLPVSVLGVWYIVAYFTWLYTSTPIFDPIGYLTGMPWGVITENTMPD